MGKLLKRQNMLTTAFKSFLKAVDGKVESQFGFKIKDASYNKLVDYMYRPKDSSSLAVTRILFGLTILFDIIDERGGAIMEQRWGSNICHFPLLSFIQPVRMPYMAVVYAGLWIGACGITFGYKYRATSILFTICYWYLFLIEKSYWNNHSYLFGLVTLLLSCSEAACFWSLDVYLGRSKQKTTVPYWNYFLLKYQLFILYFMAGVKKGTTEWLTGYSLQNLSEHWVFTPFQLFLTVQQTDYLIVHWFVFIFDLTVALWMMYSKTRHVAMLFCAMFHVMNSRLFKIGMFPWACLATMPLFYPFDWPKQVLKSIKENYKNLREYISKIYSEIDCECNMYIDELTEAYASDSDEEYSDEVFESPETVNDVQYDNPNPDTADPQFQTDPVSKEKLNVKDNLDRIIDECDTNEKKKRKVTVFLILIYVFIQAFLPYSHFITKGYNNWTNGLYGYSWDMMVHTWDTHTVLVNIKDNTYQTEVYIEPFAYTPNDRWTRHGDMVYQYAKCIDNKQRNGEYREIISNNVSIYVDIWCSMNGRFAQRLFDSKVDLVNADWSPFKKIEFLMPLLDDGIYWRERLDWIRKDVESWNHSSEVIFVADFPGYEQEKFIPEDIKNVTLTILNGTVAYVPEVTQQEFGFTYKLTNGDRKPIETGNFHTVLNIGNKPAFYMYTFYKNSANNILNNDEIKPKLSIVYEVYARFMKIILFSRTVVKSFIDILYNMYFKL